MGFPRRIWLFLPLLGLLAGCDDSTEGNAPPADGGSDADTGGDGNVVDLGPQPVDGVQVRMDFTRAGGFYSTPFPSEGRRTAAGIDVADFPNPEDLEFVSDILEVLTTSADGFGLTSGIFFSLTAAPAAELPAVHDTVEEDSPVFLVSVDAEAPDYGQRYPVRVYFEADGGPFGTPNQLALIPVNGIPMREGTLYAAGIHRDLGDAAGVPLGVSLEMAQLAARVQPDGLSEAAFATYNQALSGLEELGVDLADLAGLTVFRTGRPTDGLYRAFDQVTAAPLPEPEGPFEWVETQDAFCVYSATIEMPDFQSGESPYAEDGGRWELDGEGNLVDQGTATARIFATVPRQDMPENGFPLVVFVRTGGGGDRPLIDRGMHVVGGDFDAVEPGTGPALQFARAGFAGASADLPHGGLRNATGGDEQLAIFNVENPYALRDNIRESALETALLGEIMANVRIDASDCDGLDTPEGDGEVFFDLDRSAVMGHSTGSTIADLALAIQPHYRAGILSGAGGSYIENILYKLRPFAVRPVANLILGYNGVDRTVTEHDPVLTLLQWAGEPADPPAYNRYVIQEPRNGGPRHVLMVQGIVDTYLLPPIANGMSLALGLDMAGDQLDVGHPDLTEFTPLGDLLDLVDRQHLELPLAGNQTVEEATVTDVVVQHLEDGIEDGHEVVFQLPGPKHQYRCFLETFAAGEPPVVPVAGEELDPCE